ncbi:hypothetical protein [Akkermansia sp.]|uniref:hypothetical protein n=1 Tax=Akkermansia sp. TaxID=1872421 RepID=UPI0025BF968A|nr:hypothetical protein [Akkermansia sp.]MCC8149408.1 hypothetical protein [Akkermansia sp.]
MNEGSAQGREGGFRYFCGMYVEENWCGFRIRDQPEPPPRMPMDREHKDNRGNKEIFPFPIIPITYIPYYL